MISHFPFHSEHFFFKTLNYIIHGLYSILILLIIFQSKLETKGLVFFKIIKMTHFDTKLLTVDILVLPNQNIHKSLCGLCFRASDPLIDRFY